MNKPSSAVEHPKRKQDQTCFCKSNYSYKIQRDPQKSSYTAKRNKVQVQNTLTHVMLQVKINHQYKTKIL